MWRNIVYIALLLLLMGCKCPCAVTGGSHSDTHDSIRTEYIHDSIRIDRWHTIRIQGDTVYIHDSIDRWKEKIIEIHDSIDNSRIDTITQTIEIEKQGAAFWKGSGIAFWILLGILIIGIAIGIIIKIAK